MKEKIYRKIKETQKRYEISNHGDVRNIKTGRIMKQARTYGYCFVRLITDGGYRTFRTHRLVAEYFVPTVDGSDCVNHKDLKRDNNVFTNLEWVTHKQNIEHAINNGAGVGKHINQKSGEDFHRSKLTQRQIEYVRDTYPKKNSVRLAKELGVTSQNISNILLGKTWRESI